MLAALLASSHEVNSRRDDQGRVRCEPVSRWGAQRKVEPAIHDLATRELRVSENNNGTDVETPRFAAWRGVAWGG